MSRCLGAEVEVLRLELKLDEKRSSGSGSIISLEELHMESHEFGLATCLCRYHEPVRPYQGDSRKEKSDMKQSSLFACHHTLTV